METKKCTCNICKEIDIRRWNIIEECKCYCHISEEINGHENLCCEYPNGKKIDNPFKITYVTEHAKITK